MDTGTTTRFGWPAVVGGHSGPAHTIHTKLGLVESAGPAGKGIETVAGLRVIFVLSVRLLPCLLAFVCCRSVLVLVYRVFPSSPRPRPVPVTLTTLHRYAHIYYASISRMSHCRTCLFPRGRVVHTTDRLASNHLTPRTPSTPFWILEIPVGGVRASSWST